MMMCRPDQNEYAPYYERYISLVSASDIIPVLEEQITEIKRYASAVSLEREDYRYAAGKWSIREVFGHIIDGERVFGYRAFCIRRGEMAPLPMFNENAYIAQSHYDQRPLAELVEEFIAVRRVNLILLNTLNEDDWNRVGTASNKSISTRALAFLMAGHAQHHLHGLKNNYGVGIA